MFTSPSTWCPSTASNRGPSIRAHGRCRSASSSRLQDFYSDGLRAAVNSRDPIIPFISWLAAITSAVMIGALWTSGELGVRGGVVFATWFLGAMYVQFYGTSMTVAAIGLALQTILAAYLSIRLKLSY